ncbi:MAG TPA: methanogenesis marker 14 protein [Methanothrix sp.]|nr:methanogenesis marker 14 protein [Methanothrix sp.]HQA62453.1 methanogenesis marker 14 protein [Methanothrix sp.]
MDILELKKDPYYIVASVEVGNSTTKCILTATNMKNGQTRIVNKTVKMTRDVRKPKPGEEVFAHTLCGTPLTRESVSDLVRDTLLESHARARLSIKDDLNFVVRSTGVVAGFSSPDEVGTFIQALADGCLIAGVPPRLMTPAMSIQNIPDRFRPYSLMDRIVFNGPVASVFPPKGSTGVEIVANEMEGELATAGIKEGSKWTDVDFRNPCLSLDFGTTLDGRITSAELPYSSTIGNFCGLAGAIPDALIQGTGLVDPQTGTTLDLFSGKKVKVDKTARDYARAIDEHIRIERVPVGRSRYGSVPVDPAAAEKIGVLLIGCDVGENGSQLNRLAQIGREIYQEKGLKTLFAAIDVAAARTARRLVEVAVDAGLVTKDTAIGVTGRAGISGNKPDLILEEIGTLNLYDQPEKNVVFVDDGLARGAAVMARCMNSMGTPKHPMGGLRGGGCILKKRIEYEART